MPTEAELLQATAEAFDALEVARAALVENRYDLDTQQSFDVAQIAAVELRDYWRDIGVFLGTRPHNGGVTTVDDEPAAPTLDPEP